MGLQRRAHFVNMPVCTVKGQGGPGADGKQEGEKACIVSLFV